jgi:hypothetical protein
MMVPIKQEVVGRLTALACQGAPPSQILHHLAEWLPQSNARKVALIKYMRAAFGLTLEQASPIAGWAGEGGELSDPQLDDLMAASILGTKELWGH